MIDPLLKYRRTLEKQDLMYFHVQYYKADLEISHRRTTSVLVVHDRQRKLCAFCYPLPITKSAIQSKIHLIS